MSCNGLSLQHCVVTLFHQFPVTFTYSFVTCSIVNHAIFLKQDAQGSAVASFNDSRCAGQMVCPNDPLLFTCTVTDSPSPAARVILPSGEGVLLTITNMTQVIGATSLPDGVTEQSHNAIGDGPVNYTLALAIERASLLGGDPVICDAATAPALTDEASCPIATGIYSISM